MDNEIYIQSGAKGGLDFLRLPLGEEKQLEFLMGLIRGVQLREREKVANFVEVSKRFDNASLARDIRNGKYED